MGDIVDQDRAYSLGVVHKVLAMYEMKYAHLGDDTTYSSISACMFFLVTCLGGM